LQKKSKIDMVRKIDWESAMMVIIPLAAIYGFYSLIITNYIYYLVLIVIALILIFIDYYFIKKLIKNSYLITFVMIFVFIFAIFSFVLMAYKDNFKTEIFIVKLNNCHNRGMSTVSFKLKDKTFNRLLNFNNYSKQDLKDNYYIKLHLKQPLKKIYYIESMNLIHRDSIPVHCK